MALVRHDFAVPPGAATTLFVLEPLGPQHNAADLAAWTSSIAHIRATPGFAGRPWPDSLFLEENETDLVRHAEDFTNRTGFTYTVLDPATGEVIGCVYLYPASPPAGYDVEVRSWVTADRADLDKPLYQFVCEWLAGVWPFSEPDYAER